MARMIDGDKLVENLRLIATCWSVSPYVSKEKHNGAVDMLREVEREVKEAPTLTQPNEPLTCEGCIYERNEHENCNYCKRAPYLGDYYYRRPPEGEEDT